MRLLNPTQRLSLRSLLPDRPGPQIGRHVLNTGHGACWTDRWPDPRAILSQVDDNYALQGDARAIEPKDLELRFFGLLEASNDFVPLVKAVYEKVDEWPRKILELRRPAPELDLSAELRALVPTDAYQLHGLSLETAWVADSWGGPAGLASCQKAWGAFVQGELASLAAPFFVGDRYEDIAVVTVARYRGRGFNPACAARVAREIQSRGRIPSWSTSPDNLPSLRVAEKLGFEWVRDDRLLAIGIEIPPSAKQPDPSPRLP